jgi:hypothetical protein
MRNVPLNATTGTFRIADVQFGTPAVPYKIAVWADVNGDGVIDAGDYFGVSSTTQNCPTTSACTAAANIVVHPVTTGFVLP